ncbi:hypothetical protein [Nocardiopsis gilva]|uniref:hypothetical protein n=1 Tax=Nocardiopsis gilva TaxID=280236 RepID=UPI0003711AE2|nr:hypothetical protein [Nocardiopsis gilva]
MPMTDARAMTAQPRMKTVKAAFDGVIPVSTAYMSPGAMVTVVSSPAMPGSDARVPWARAAMTATTVAAIRVAVVIRVRR